MELFLSLLGGCLVGLVFLILGTYLDRREDTKYDRELRALIKREKRHGA